MAVDGPDSASDSGSSSDVSDDRGGSSVSDSDRSDFGDAQAEASRDSGGSDSDDDGSSSGSGPSSAPDTSSDDDSDDDSNDDRSSHDDRSSGSYASDDNDSSDDSGPSNNSDAGASGNDSSADDTPGDDGAADRAANDAATEDAAAAEDAARAAAEDAVAEDAVVEDTMQREIDARRSMAESLAEAGVDLSGRPISDSAVAAARASRDETAPASVDPSVDPMDDPDTIDRAANDLDPDAFAATPEARAEAADIIAERSSEYVAGISGFTDIEIDERGIADDLVTIARSDPERAAGIAEALTTQLSPLEAEIVDHHATEAMENARLAEFKLDTRPFGAPAGEVAPGDARQAADDLLAGATSTGLFGGTRIDAEGLAEGLVGIRGADPDLAVEAYRTIARTLDPADAARLDRELERQPYAPGVSVLSPYERRATDIPIVSDIIGDSLAGMQGLWRGATGGPDYAVNPLTGRVLTGRDLQDAKFGAFIELATLGLGKAITGTARGARAVDEMVPPSRPPEPPSGLPSSAVDEVIGVERFVPEAPLSVSNAHSIDTITPRTYFGGGNRTVPKTVARGDVDLAADLAEINAGQAQLLSDGRLLTSSGRTWGYHTDRAAGAFPREGPGLVQLTQAEFGVLKQMVDAGGLTGNAERAFEGMLRAGNQGLTEQSRDTLIDLYASRTAP